MISCTEKGKEKVWGQRNSCNGDKIQRPNSIANCDKQKNIVVARWHKIQEAKMQEQEIVGMKGVLSGGQQKLKKLKPQ